MTNNPYESPQADAQASRGSWRIVRTAGGILILFGIWKMAAWALALVLVVSSASHVDKIESYVAPSFEDFEASNPMHVLIGLVITSLGESIRRLTPQHWPFSTLRRLRRVHSPGRHQREAANE